MLSLGETKACTECIAHDREYLRLQPRALLKFFEIARYFDQSVLDEIIDVVWRGMKPTRFAVLGEFRAKVQLSAGLTAPQRASVSVQRIVCFNPQLLKLSNPVGSNDYMTAQYAVISQTDSLHGCVKDALEHAGAELEVVAAAPDFMSILETALSSARHLNFAHCALLRTAIGA